MYNSEMLYKIAELRRKELIQEAENHRLLRAKKGKRGAGSNPKFTWALLGTTIAAALISLVV